jgi:hypothetical protein
MSPEEQELTQALVAADAAGDTASATKIASAIRTIRERTRLQADQIGSMSTFNKVATGTGRGFNDVGQGIKQLGLRVMDAMTPGFNPGRADDYTKQVGEELALYEPLKKDSPWLTGGGRLVGNVAALPIPAGAGATLLQRMGTSALAGGAQGAMQFVPEGGSRGLNTAFGATIGALIPALLQGGKVTVGAVQTLAGKLKDALPPMTQAAREQMAAKMLREAAADPATLARAAQPQALVPGTVQSLAEVTDDAGIAGLQRTMRSMSPELNNRLGLTEQANNVARVEAVRGAFGGADEAAATAIEQARDRAAAPLLAAARKVTGVNTKPVLALADKILKAREGNDTVTAAVQRVRDLLGREGMDTVQNLHNARQEIGTILSGKSSMEQAGRTASRELLHIRQALDTQIGRASPEFKKFLKQYADLSRDADRVRMGSELLGKSFASADSVGNPVLSPAKFSGARRDLDRVAQQATGFRKQTAERLMTPEQLQTVQAVGGDLERFARSQVQGRATGSNTAQNLAGMSRVQDAALGGDELRAALLPQLSGAMSILNGFRRKAGEKVLQIVQEALVDPARAPALMRTLTAAQRQQVATALQNQQLRQALEVLRVAGPGTTAAAVVGGPEQQ